ncbi:proline-rich protein 2-like isoform X2 [Gallus gallus]|uniref:proline-rich protein 2-like isoform X2 n=1 Tax=Gallus gallus TaxID=9031 RepID=UPI001F029E14|nr:proline-rich protein 2-like isoform X2 [Gallus gallus]
MTEPLPPPPQLPAPRHVLPPPPPRRGPHRALQLAQPAAGPLLAAGVGVVVEGLHGLVHQLQAGLGPAALHGPTAALSAALRRPPPSSGPPRRYRSAAVRRGMRSPRKLRKGKFRPARKCVPRRLPVRRCDSNSTPSPPGNNVPPQRVLEDDIPQNGWAAWDPRAPEPQPHPGAECSPPDPDGHSWPRSRTAPIPVTAPWALTPLFAMATNSPVFPMGSGVTTAVPRVPETSAPDTVVLVCAFTAAFVAVAIVVVVVCRCWKRCCGRTAQDPAALEGNRNGAAVPMGAPKSPED